MLINKKLLLGIIILLLALIGVWLYVQSTIPTSEKVINSTITKISIEDLSGPETVILTNQNKIKLLVAKLEQDKWKPIKQFELKFAPNFYISTDNGLIGLFGSGEPYAKVKVGKKVKYYNIPTEVYDNVKSYFNSQNIVKFGQGEVIDITKSDILVRGVFPLYSKEPMEFCFYAAEAQIIGAKNFAYLMNKAVNIYVQKDFHVDDSFRPHTEAMKIVVD